MDFTTWVSIGLLVVLALWMMRRTGTRLYPYDRGDERKRPGSRGGSDAGSAG